MNEFLDLHSEEDDRKEEFTDHLERLEPRKRLSEQDERRIFQKIKEGNQDARVQLIESYYPWVKDIAEKYLPQLKSAGLSFEDLVQEGMAAVTLVVDRFDPKKTVSRLSVFVNSRVNRAIKTAIERGTKSPGFDKGEPDDEENVDFDKFKDETAENPEEVVLNQEFAEQFNQALDSLNNKRASDIIRLRLGIDDEMHWSFSDIASKYHISQVRAREIFDDSLKAILRRSDKFPLIYEWAKEQGLF